MPAQGPSLQRSVTELLAGWEGDAVSLPLAPASAWHHRFIQLSNHFGSRDVARLIEQGVHPLLELHRMRQFRMLLECVCVHPPRMNEKESRVPHRTKGVKTQAASLLARRSRHIMQRLFHVFFFSFTRMQPHKHVSLHAPSIPRRTSVSVPAFSGSRRFGPRRINLAVHRSLFVYITD